MIRELRKILKGIEGLEIKKSPPFRELTTVGTGGPAAALLIPATVFALSETIRRLEREGIPYFTFGRGSNILVPDEGVGKVAISLASGLTGVEFNGKGIRIESGTTLPRAAVLAAASDLSGLEELAGIPGTIGGAVMMNAGAFGREIGELVQWVEVATADGGLTRVDRDELVFSYRSFSMPVEGVLVKVCLKLKKGDRDVIFSRMRELNRERKEKQPWGEKTFGSVFKNPEGMSAGKLIDEAGLKGYTVGGACVSKKHGNFIVNLGNATTKDIVMLMEVMKDRVLRVHGVELEPEVRRVA